VDGFDQHLPAPNVKHGCRFASDANDCRGWCALLRSLTSKLLIDQLSPSSRTSPPSGGVERPADALSLINTIIAWP